MEVFLKHDVSFDVANVTVVILRGSKILVDPAHCVGFHNGFHFHIEPDEYSSFEGKKGA
jgi:hypothetical protein